MGVIAQNVRKSCLNWSCGRIGVMAVKYRNLVAVLIEAVKAQQKEIDTLKRKITA